MLSHLVLNFLFSEILELRYRLRAARLTLPSSLSAVYASAFGCAAGQHHPHPRFGRVAPSPKCLRRICGQWTQQLPSWGPVTWAGLPLSFLLYFSCYFSCLCFFLLPSSVILFVWMVHWDILPICLWGRMPFSYWFLRAQSPLQKLVFCHVFAVFLQFLFLL